MMNRRNSLLTLSLAVLLSAISCDREAKDTSRTTIPFVTEIIEDKSNAWNTMLSGSWSDPQGDICIIGAEKEVRDLAEILAESDVRDNIDATAGTDRLYDFAGETFVCIADTLNHPYSRFVEAGKEDALREVTVRLVLNAVDTVAHISPFDENGLGIKNRAKLIILADPYLSMYGESDADSLLRSFGCGIPVLSPIDIAYNKVLSSGKASMTVGVICDKETAASSVHSGKLREAAKKRGISADCVVFPASQENTDAIRDFLDRYISVGFEKPLDAIIIDDYDVDMEEAKTNLANLISLMNEESMTYRKYISDGFLFLSTGSSAVEYCYDFLRINNLFTHNISQPEISVYYTCPGYGEKEGELVLISDSYVQN